MKSCRSCSASNSPVASRFTRPSSPSRRCTSSDRFSSDSTESSSVDRASASCGSRLVPLADQALGLADPPLDVAAEPVLLLVGLAEPVELGRRLAPGPVDLGLAPRRRRARPRRPRRARRPPRRRRPRPRRRLLRASARAASAASSSARSCDRVVGGELVALGPQLGEPGVVRWRGRGAGSRPRRAPTPAAAAAAGSSGIVLGEPAPIATRRSRAHGDGLVERRERAAGAAPLPCADREVALERPRAARRRR